MARWKLGEPESPGFRRGLFVLLIRVKPEGNGHSQPADHARSGRRPRRVRC